MNTATDIPNVPVSEESASTANAVKNTTTQPKNAPRPTQSIASYQDDVWESAWKRRSAGLVSGIFLGMLFGGTIGALSLLSVAALVPAIGLAGITTGAVLTAAGAFGSFAAFTMLMGGLGDVGVVSGAVAAGLKEQDTRNAAFKGIATTTPTPETPSFNIFKGSKTPNPYVVVTALACGLGVGLFMAGTGAGFVAPLVTSLFPKVAAASLLAATKVMLCTSCMLTFGCVSLDFAKITKNTAGMVGHIFSGKIFEGNKSPAPEQNIEAQQAETRGQAKAKEQTVVETAFKSNTVKTVVAPIGSYAGKEASFHTRKLAEQQFHAMDPRSTIPH